MELKISGHSGDRLSANYAARSRFSISADHEILPKKRIIKRAPLERIGKLYAGNFFCENSLVIRAWEEKHLVAREPGVAYSRVC